MIPPTMPEIVAADSPISAIVKIHNDPTNPCEFAKFQLLAAIFDAVDLKVGKADTTAASSPPLTIPTTNQDVSVKVQSGTATAANDDAQYGFTFSNLAMACGNPPSAQKTYVIPTQNTALPTEPSPAPVQRKYNRAASQQPAKPSCPPAGKGPLIITRSPEGIVYYLGELIQADLHRREPGWVPELKIKYVGNTPLFDVRQGPSPGAGAVVTVSVDGDDYYIPREDDYNNSMHFLTLVEQLIALQKKGTQLPTIPTVQVLNQ